MATGRSCSKPALTKPASGSTTYAAGDEPLPPPSEMAPVNGDELRYQKVPRLFKMPN